MKKLFFFLLFCILQNTSFSQSNSNGVPAAPFPFTYQQPDGDIITIYIKGDGAVHWYQTTDGYTIMQDLKGVYYYATEDENGDLTITNVRVSNADMRTSDEITFLQDIEPEARYSSSQIETMKKGYLPYPEGSVKGGSFPTTGTNRLLMILQDFPDASFTHASASFENMMNQENYNGTGSFKQYYFANSYGQLTMVTTVVGWYTASNNHDYYCDGCSGANPNTTYREFVQEAVDNAEAAGVDFSQFDNDGDGNVDGVMVIHQGDGAEMGDNTNIWSHSWSLFGMARTYDGVTIDDYTMNPETSGGGAMGTIGVLCHEFGHNLSLPDFYDTDYSTNGQGFDLGDWDCMAGGSYNGGGATPAMHNAWSKISLGWMTATELNTACSYTLNPIYENPEAYIYNTTTSGEYFLLENRQQTGFDIAIPGHGMLIYHVDENYTLSGTNVWTNNKVNAVSTHQAMDLEEADFTQSDTDMAGDPFPGTSNNTSFTDATSPNSQSWAGANTNKPLTNITEDGNNITFDFMGGASSNPTGFSASTISSTQLDISWTLNGSSDPVMVAYNTTNTFGIPTPGNSYSINDPIAGGGTVIYNSAGTSTSHSSLSTGTTYYYKAWSVATGQVYSCGITTNGKTCQVLDVLENFDSPQSDWSPQTSNSYAWVKIAGTTPSASTGPSADNSGSGAYMFTEASSPAAAGDDTYLYSPAIDLSNANTPTIDFYYHMYGAAMGTLSVEIYDGGLWTQLWSISNQQHSSENDPWTLHSIDLSSYKNQYEQIRFKGVRGSDYTSDMAIDDISIYDNFTCSAPSSQASNFNATATQNSLNISWSRGNGDNVLVVAREGGIVDTDPIIGNSYSGNSSFNLGDEIGTGNYVVYNGSGTSTTVTDLSSGTTYYFAFYEYNNTDICYLFPSYTNSATTSFPPPVANFSASATSIVSGNSIDFTDLSTNSPTSWSWSFPGGTPSSSVAQNPSNITYSTAGIYNVSLTATNATGSDIETKTGYITVSAATIQFATASTNTSESTSGSSTCRGYSDISLTIQVDGSPNIDEEVTVAVTGGTGYSPADAEITTSMPIVCTGGSSADKTVTIRIYDDMAIENSETIELSISIAGNSDASVGTQSSHTITISDNDSEPTSSSTSTIWTENWDSPVNWYISQPSSGRRNNWVIGSGCTGDINGSTAQVAYYTTTTGPNCGYARNGSHPIYLYKQIDGSSYTNLTASFNWKCLGESGADYGRLEYSTDGSTWFQVPGTGDYQGQSSTQATGDIDLSSLDGQTFYLGFAFYCDGDNTNNNPGFSIDDIEVTGTIPGVGVATTNTYSTSQYLGPESSVYFYDDTDGNLLAKIENTSTHDFGCTSVGIDRAGTNSIEFWNSGTSYDLMAKSLLINPSTNNVTAGYNITLYYTESEVSGWEASTGNSRAAATIAKTGGSINNISASSPDANGSTNYVGTSTTTGSFGNNFWVKSSFESGFSGFGTGIPGAPPAGSGTLPVELLFFKASTDNSDVILSWATSSEINNDYFEIEKSTDLKTFEEIGKVKGLGNSNQLTKYEFTDKNYNQKTSYYRLKQFDYNGNFKYSKAVAVGSTGKNNLKDASSIEIYPNPFKEELNILIAHIESSRAKLKIVNSFGEIIMVRTLNGINDNAVTLEKMNLSELPKGIYYIQIIAGSINHSKKIIKH